MVEWSTIKALHAFLDANEPRLVYFLVTFWNNQERAITYKELREAILAGDIDPEWLEQWQQDYSVFVTTYLQPLWLSAIDSAANDLQEWLKANNRTDVMDWFDPVADGIKEWVSQRAAEFVTNSSQEQMDAIRAVVQRAAVMEDMTVDKLARAIRPMVGLTKQQAVANMNYYQTLLKNGISETKARDLSIRYAARQHRYRGYNIARTELSFSFNKGADDGARQAQEYGVLGDLEKVWDAAEDERTCPICGALDGQRIAMNEEFDFPTKLAATNPGIRRTPPAHPSCRCGVKYVEVTDPVIKSLECIEEVEKYNPYHDARGRFTSAPGGAKGSGGGTKGSEGKGTTMTTSQLAGSDALKEYEYIGVRTLTPDEKYKVGDTARESYDWDFENDRSTYETDGRTLGGTAAINIVRDRHQDGEKEVENALRDALNTSESYEGERKVIIGGNRQRYGDDPSETIIENAKVIAVLDPKTGKWNTNTPKQSKPKTDSKQTTKPKVSSDDVNRYKDKLIDDYIADHPGMSRLQAMSNLPGDKKKQITALQNYSNTGDEKWLDGFDLSTIGKSGYDYIQEIGVIKNE